MAKVHRSKRKAVDYLYKRDLNFSGETEPKENFAILSPRPLKIERRYNSCLKLI